MLNGPFFWICLTYLCAELGQGEAKFHLNSGEISACLFIFVVLVHGVVILKSSLGLKNHFVHGVRLNLSSMFPCLGLVFVPVLNSLKGVSKIRQMVLVQHHYYSPTNKINLI